jgi:deoxyribodipyrimidine photo-lyase
MHPTILLWLRRDLRLHDHPALAAAIERAGPGGTVAPLYVLDPVLLHGRWSSPNRNAFLLGSLAAIAADLEGSGSSLRIEVGRAGGIVPRVATEIGATDVVVTRDRAPYGRRRDRTVAARLGSRRRLHRVPGLLVHEPEAVRTAEGRPHAGYAPFRRAWERLPRRPLVPRPDALPPAPAGWGGGPIPSAAELGLDPPSADPGALLEPGEAAARARLDAWLAGGLGAYAERRDDLRPGGTTSRLSQDLRFGLLSPLEVVERVLAAGDGASSRRFVGELAWREFHAHVLWHWPEVLAGPFRPDAAPAWADDEAAFRAWRDGRTGYPIVDAAMRELHATGFMPNRARMVVASFLAKDLLVDWRRGEAEFMRHLVDGDPAQNNGNWQWSAATGPDAQPFFRVFNPVLQGERFDRDGAWVRRWLPELAGVAADRIHRPWELGPAERESAGLGDGAYPEPIVEHRAARERALAAHAAARAKRQAEREAGSAGGGRPSSRSRRRA